MFAACILAQSHLANAQFQIEHGTSDLVLDKGLVVDGVAEIARRPINTDAVVAGLAEGSLDLVQVRDGAELVPGHAWHQTSAEAGAFEGGRPGTYVLIRVQSDDARVMMLEASGHALVYVNGEPRVGDPYGQNYAALPIMLRKGDNSLLFAHASRGPMRASLHTPAAQILIAGRDLTVPDVLVGGESELLLGVPLINASMESRTVSVICDSGGSQAKSGSFVIPKCTLVKVPVRAIVLPLAAAKEVVVHMSVMDGETVLASHDVTLTVREPSATHKRTYTSRVDGSVQYLSIVPPTDESAAPALVLSLHGASVEATSQAASYAAKPGMVIACPTNRRPYGFDWEEWGRIDAIEVMDLVARTYKTDPARAYLTGHSMGGHGTWSIGVLYPQRFAAIAPSAGWLSFDSYVGAGGPPHSPDTKLGQAFAAARSASMTLDYFANLKGKGIFILHGDADDNVPVEQARAARGALDKLGITYGFHEQPGAGHWWDDDKPGAACLDWPDIWKTFAASTLDTKTAVAVQPPLDDRGFVNGAFKRVFDRGFTLVYSTGGTEAENAWSFAKARFDAEQWWYRGNGHAELTSDAEWLKAPTDGNVILYGSADTNRAWPALIDSRIVNIARDEASAGGRVLHGSDLGCLLAIPRKGNTDSLVGVIGGTGLAGMRATERLGYFSSGVGFPSVVLLRADVWREGFAHVEGGGQPDAMIWKDASSETKEAAQAEPAAPVP